MVSASMFFRNYVPKEAYPLIGIVGGALFIASSMLIHTARQPDIVWKHSSNPFPWLNQKDKPNYFFIPHSLNESHKIPFEERTH